MKNNQLTSTPIDIIKQREAKKQEQKCKNM